MKIFDHHRKTLSLKQRLFQWNTNTAGSTAVSFALALPAVLGVVGLATDYGIASSKKAKLQIIADEAAIAAVKELALVNSTPTSVAAGADAYVARQMSDATMIEESSSSLSSTSGTSDVSVTAEIGAGGDNVTVTVQEVWSPFFAHYLGADITPIVSQATAKLAGKTNLCVLALETADDKALHMDINAHIQATGCAIYSNSLSSQGIRLDANAQIESSMVCSAGGVMSKAGVIKPAATTDCPTIADPLAARQPPDLPSCDNKNIDLDKGNHTLDPGAYCGGLKISGSAKVTFTPGEYVVRGGKFEISGDAQVTSNNAAFYLEGDATTLQFTENTTLQMTGAKTGSMAGLLFFEDRSVNIGRKHRINSLHADELTGTIYLSRGTLLIDPTTPVAQDSAYTAIIANKVELSEGPTLVLNDDYGATDVPVPEGINRDVQVVLSK